MKKLTPVLAGLVPALFLASTLSHAGAEHGRSNFAQFNLPAPLAAAVTAQHEHDFHTARSLLHRFMEQHPGHAQALLVLSAVEAATGHWDAMRAACAPLSTQLPSWVVAACLAQGAEGEDNIRALLQLIESRAEGPETPVTQWADAIAAELQHRLHHRHFKPHAPHPE